MHGRFPCSIEAEESVRELCIFIMLVAIHQRRFIRLSLQTNRLSSSARRKEEGRYLRTCSIGVQNAYRVKMYSNPILELKDRRKNVGITEVAITEYVISEFYCNMHTYTYCVVK